MRAHAGPAGDRDRRCIRCGYGVTVYRELLRCPMCGATAWDSVASAGRSREAPRASPL